MLRLAALVICLGVVFVLAKELIPDMQNQKEERRQYYKSWASYQIPMRPTDPVDFKQTETLDAFYLAAYDADGRLRRFTKYLVERAPVGRQPLAGSRPPHSILYFAAPSATDDAPPPKLAPADEIDYPATEGLVSYFKGQVDDSGKALELERIRRRTFFVDEYVYWPNGKLKERVMTGADGTAKKSSFDEDGQQIQ
jgi:hypothetical protein